MSEAVKGETTEEVGEEEPAEAPELPPPGLRIGLCGIFREGGL